MDRTELTMDTDSATAARVALEESLYEIKRVIVGQDAMLERVLVALLSVGMCSSRACRASRRPSP